MKLEHQSSLRIFFAIAICSFLNVCPTLKAAAFPFNMDEGKEILLSDGTKAWFSVQNSHLVVCFLDSKGELIKPTAERAVFRYHHNGLPAQQQNEQRVLVNAGGYLKSTQLVKAPYSFSRLTIIFPDQTFSGLGYTQAHASGEKGVSEPNSQVLSIDLVKQGAQFAAQVEEEQKQLELAKIKEQKAQEAAEKERVLEEEIQRLKEQRANEKEDEQSKLDQIKASKSEGYQQKEDALKSIVEEVKQKKAEDEVQSKQALEQIKQQKTEEAQTKENVLHGIKEQLTAKVLEDENRAKENLSVLKEQKQSESVESENALKEYRKALTNVKEEGLTVESEKNKVNQVNQAYQNYQLQLQAAQKNIDSTTQEAMKAAALDEYENTLSAIKSQSANKQSAAIQEVKTKNIQQETVKTNALKALRDEMHTFNEANTKTITQNIQTINSLKQEHEITLKAYTDKVEREQRAVELKKILDQKILELEALRQQEEQKAKEQINEAYQKSIRNNTDFHTELEKIKNKGSSEP